MLTTDKELKQNQREKIMFLTLTILNFFPFYVGVVYFFLMFFYLAYIGRIRFRDLSLNATSDWLTLFSFYSLLVSILNYNIWGMAASLLYFIFILYFNYFNKFSTGEMFDQFINVCLLGSLAVFIYAVFEHFEIVGEWDYSFIASSLSKNHPQRVEATFFNPNYFAMALEFFIIMGLYKLITSKTRWKRWVYLFLTLSNIVASLFTGNRTGPIVIFVSVVVFFYVLSYRKTVISLILIVGLGLIISVFTGHYPRVDSLLWALDDRIEIWKTALHGIKNKFVFGQGPYTYMMIYDKYGGNFTYHAHSIYLDSLLNYGVVGCGILLVAAFKYIKWLARMHQYPALKTKAALIWAFIAIFLVHGLTDMAIFWFQTAFIFLVLIVLVPKLVEEESKKATN